MADIQDTPTMPAIISRAEAKAAGLKTYFTGKFCPQGHIAPRSVSAARCVVCLNISGQTWRQKNISEVHAREAAYRDANRDKRRANWRAWAAANPDKARANKAAWKDANADKMRARHQKWAAENWEKRAASRRNRKARVKAAEGFHTADDIQGIYQAQCGKCAYCRKKVGQKYHVDHIVPLKRGGSNWPSNLQILCPACNMAKNSRDPIDHARSLGLLL